MHTQLCFFLLMQMSEYDRIRRQCVKKGELWEDVDFPTTQTSIFYHQSPPFQFSWKRPKVPKHAFIENIQQDYEKNRTKAVLYMI